MSTPNLAARIGQAWRFEREGKAEAAIAEFERILQDAPEDVDALYGMALAQRAAGHRDTAIQNFEKALRQVEAAIAARPRGDGHHERNTPEDDRNMMLARMIRQRLAELKA